MGLGLGLAFLPISGIVAKHFTRRRSLAMGIVTTGTSLGGFTFSVLVSKLLNTSLGFAWTVRVNAFIVLGCCMIGNVLLSEPKKQRTDIIASEGTMQSLSDPQEAVGDTKEVETQEQNDLEEETGTPEEKPRTISQLLRDPAYLAVIASGFVVSLGLYFPM
jgi:MFS family permease